MGNCPCFAGVISGTSPNHFGGSTPYIVICRIKAKQGTAKQYLEAAAKGDNACMNDEPGMLHHTFDLDPRDPTGHTFVWSEIYADCASFHKHLKLPWVKEYVGTASQWDEPGPRRIEFVGTMDSEAMKVADSLPINNIHYKTQLGYSRVGARKGTSTSVVGVKPDKFDGSNPFIVISRIKVKRGKVNEYLEAAAAANRVVMNTEPGMQHQTFDLDPGDPTGHSFVWTEVYADSASFVKHVQNPRLGSYLGKHGELGESGAVEVLGTVDSETRKVADSLGVPVTYFKTQLGYSRVKK